MPAEDAEVIAQFMAQMIMNGVVPDAGAWGPQGGEEAERGERGRDQEGEGSEEAKKYVDIWYEAAIADAKLPGAAGVSGLRAKYDEYLRQIENGDEGLQEINTLLQDGHVVIVDILAISSDTIGGTYPVGAQGSPEVPVPSGMFAHFTRVLGFEDDGETIVLAEMILPGQHGKSDVIRVSKDDFLVAWQNHKERAILDDQTPPNYISEEVNNWYLVISPPSGQ